MKNYALHVTWILDSTSVGTRPSTLKTRYSAFSAWHEKCAVIISANLQALAFWIFLKRSNFNDEDYTLQIRISYNTYIAEKTFRNMR